MKNLLVLMGIFILLGLTGCATTGSSGPWTPLPEPGTVSAINVILPGPEVPPEIAAYSGIWEGTFDGASAATIIVEQITPPKVVAIYSWGPGSNYIGGWTRVIGRVERDSVVLVWGQPERVVTLKINPQKRNLATAEYTRGGSVLRAALFRKE
ncbi:MAG: hypothetical protein KKD92_09160 [Proteobacteria bacterium]|nr:hypothetical protein [Pseudomonadota bacterium]